jgi:eukaryotic-like serine/threonine-protein kinase
MSAINREHWRRLQPILDRALELRGEERRVWLDAACADQPVMRAAVERLLVADAQAGGILDTSPDALLTFADVHDTPHDFGSETEGGGRFLPGVILSGRYRVVSLLGRGGMGEVYRANDLKLGQPVALKFLPARVRNHPERLDELLREARIARQISHPNVCRVYDIGEAQGQTFLTMEYIDGEDLRSLLARIGHLPQRKALDIARQLCAGLQAAHDLGILHRDLKPANVMLDAKGRVRITDFGLAAVTSDLTHAESNAGTPAYMAPEQFDGLALTPRTDVYALGLVLYELFTGMRAFEGRTIDELRRLQEDSSPTKPSELVAELDRSVERVILACVEADPALRPASPRAVESALPGGDPIHLALEAGETPAPELVAASGPEGSLQPGRAFGTLAAIVVMLAVLMQLSDRASVLGWVQWPRTVDALEDNARGMLERLGYASASVDHARTITGFNDTYRRWVRSHDRSPDRWNVLRRQGQWDVLFWYRQAPRVLMPWNAESRVWSTNPSPEAGDVNLLTDLRGKLIWMMIVPEEASEPAPMAAVSPDWPILFREAGLEFGQFKATEPTRNPSVAFDRRAAWSGTADASGGYPIRVEAATLRGKPVYFEQIVPWDPYWDPSPNAVRPRTRFDTLMFRVLSLVSLIVMPVTAAVLVWRNWLNGRGDRRGALRVATIVLCLRFSIWLIGAHHVPALPEEWMLFTIGLGKSLTHAAAVWIMYIALEPYARRLHARFLVAWNRLILRARWRDALVGREVLYGVALSTVSILATQLSVVLPRALRLDAPPPPSFFPLGPMPFLPFLNPPQAETLLGGRFVLEAIGDVALTALGIGLTHLVVLLGLQLFLRRFWAAVVVYSVIQLFMSPFLEAANYSPISIACAVTSQTTFLLTLRFGLISTLSFLLSVFFWMNFPVTANLSAPHFGTGLLGVLSIAGLATFGAVTAARNVRQPWSVSDSPARGLARTH